MSELPGWQKAGGADVVVLFGAIVPEIEKSIGHFIGHQDIIDRLKAMDQKELEKYNLTRLRADEYINWILQNPTLVNTELKKAAGASAKRKR